MLSTADSEERNAGDRRPWRLATQIVSNFDAAVANEQQQQQETSNQNAHFNASSMPIYQTATFRQSSATEMGAFDYTRSGNPTRSHLGRRLIFQFFLNLERF